MGKLANTLIAAVVCATMAASARAATIDVTTTADSVADDGLCSLREAVTSANTGSRSGSRSGECVAGSPLPAVDLIKVPAGTYRLSRGASGEDANAGGDLDITQSVVIAGAGPGQTIIRNAIGDRAVRGDGDRLFHADPAGAGGVDVTLRGLAMMDGDVGCTGERCTTGASAVEADGDGPLTLANTRVMKNSSFCFGDRCGDEDAATIRAVGGGALTIRRSLIKRNRAACEGEECSAGSSAIQMWNTETSAGDLVLERTVVKANSSTCEGVGCEAFATIDVDARDASVRATKILRNANTCTGTGCWAGEATALAADGRALVEKTTFRENDRSCEEERCDTGGLLYLRANAVDMRSVVGDRNFSSCEGVECTVAENVSIHGQDGGSVTVEGLEVTSSGSTCLGDRCRVNDVIQLTTLGDVALADALISEAGGTCIGVECDTDNLLVLDGASVTVVRNELLSNDLTCIGQECETEAVVSLYAGPGPVIARDVSTESNTNGCYGSDCSTATFTSIFSASSNVTLERFDMSRNLTECGFHGPCSAGGILNAQARLGIDADTLSLTENEVSCFGADCRIAPVAKVSGGLSGVHADHLVVGSNRAACEGQACIGAEVFSFPSGAGSTITNGSFTANRSECAGTSCWAGFGGALRNATQPLTITDTTFSQNVTDGFGAAVYNDTNAELILDRVVMTANRANLDGPSANGGYGGAIFNDGLEGHLGVLRISSSDIRGNQAGRTGGGIYNMGAIVSFAGSTLSGNLPNDCLQSGGTGCP